MLETSKRHVGKMSMCMCGLFGCLGLTVPSLGRWLPEEGV